MTDIFPDVQPQEQEQDGIFPEDLGVNTSGNRPQTEGYKRQRALINSQADSKLDPEVNSEDSDMLYEQHYAAVRSGLVQDVQDRLSGKAQARELESLTRTMQNVAESGEGDVDAVEGLLLLRDELAAGVASPIQVERAGVGSMLDSSVAASPELTHLALQNEAFGTVMEQAERYISRRAYLEETIDQLRTERDDQGFIRDAYEFIEGGLNILDYYLTLDAMVDTADNTDGTISGVRSIGQRVIDQRAALEDPFISDEEYVRRVDELKARALNGGFFNKLLPNNRARALQVLEYIKSADESTKTDVNLWGAVDIATAVAGTAALRGANNSGSVIKTLKTTNNNEEAAKQVVQNLRNKKESVTDTQEAVSETLPSVLTRTKYGRELSLSPYVNDTDRVVDALYKELEQFQSAARLTPDELEKAVSTATQRAKDEFAGQYVRDIRWTPQRATLGNDVNTLDILIGKVKTPSGYVSRTSAENAARRRGIEDFTVVQETDGMHYIQVSRDITEEGFKSGLEINPDQSFLKSWLLRHTTGARFNIEKDTVIKGDIVDSSLQGIRAEIVAPLNKKITNLKKGSVKKLDNVLREGHTDEKWFTPSELIARGFTPREVEAYQAARVISDLDYRVRNTQEYKKYATAGYRTVDIDSGAGLQHTGLGIVQSPNTVNLATDRLYDASLDIHYAAGTLAKERFDEMVGSGYRVVTVLDTVKDAAGKNPVKHMLIREGEFALKPLPENIIPYRAGGHRIYDGRWFVKQARQGTYTDTGENFLMNPLTHVVSKTQKEAAQWAEDMELARAAYKKFIDNPTNDTELLARQMIERTTVETLEEFQRLVDNEFIDPNSVFRVVFDREELPEIKQSRGLQVNDLTDEISTGLTSWMQTNGRSFAGKRGEHLINPQGELAELVDPLKSIENGFTQALRAGVMYNYTSAQVERWSKAALQSGFVDADFVAKKPSPYELFTKARFTENNTIVEQLEAARDVIKRQAGFQTKSGQVYSETVKNVGLWLEDKPIGTWASQRAYDMMDSNPLSAVKGFAFHTKLGLFNIAQFPLQMNTAFAVSAIDPKSAAKGWMSYRPIRHMQVNQTPQLLDYYANSPRWRALMGFDSADEVKEFITEFRTSGFGRVSGSISELDGVIQDNMPSYLMSKASDASRFFFDEAEILNRSVAYRMAWDRVKRKNPELDLTSDAGRLQVRDEAATLSMNMTKAHNGVLNTGWQSVPFQFMSYTQRFMEALFGRELTRTEKVRLAASQVLFYGSNVAGLNTAVDHLMNRHGENVDPTVRKFITNGLIDGTIYALSDETVDLDLSSRWSATTPAEDFLKQLFSPESRSIMDIIGGPSYSIGSDFVDASLKAALLTINAESDGYQDVADIGLDAFKEVLRNVSSFNNTEKAWIMYKYGEIVSTDGDIVTSTNEVEAAARLLGIPTGRENGRYNLVKDLYSNNRKVTEWAKVLNKYRTELMFAARDGNQDEVDLVKRKIAALRKLTDDKTRDGAPSMWQNVRSRADRLYDFNQLRDLKIKHQRQLGPAGANQITEGER